MAVVKIVTLTLELKILRLVQLTSVILGKSCRKMEHVRIVMNTTFYPNLALSVYYPHVKKDRLLLKKAYV